MSHADGILAQLARHDMAALLKAMKADDLKAVETLNQQKKQPASRNTAA